MHRFDDKKRLGNYETDGGLLYLVALWVLSGLTPFKAAEKVLKHLNADSQTLVGDQRRLVRLWDKEQELADLEGRPNRWFRYLLDVLTSFEELPPSDRLDAMNRGAVEKLLRSIRRSL